MRRITSKFLSKSAIVTRCFSTASEVPVLKMKPINYPKILAIGAFGGLVGGSTWLACSRYYEYKESFGAMKTLSSEELQELSEDCVLIFVNPDEDRKHLEFAAKNLIFMVRNELNLKVPIYLAVREKVKESEPNTLSGVFAVSSRRKVFELNSPSPKVANVNPSLDELKEFVKTVKKSQEEIDEKNKKHLVPEVSYDNFQSEVIERSKNNEIVIVMVTDPHCTLCYIMRPLMRELFKIFEELSFMFPSSKRIRLYSFDSQHSDNPPGLPSTRGTPSFVVYKNGVGELLKEFKPTELLAKLFTASPEGPEPVCAGVILTPEQLHRLGEIAQNSSKRIISIAEVTHFRRQCAVLESVLLGLKPSVDKDGEEDGGFNLNEAVTELMDWDSLFSDSFWESIARFKKEADNAEQEMLGVGIMLAQKVESVESEARKRYTEYEQKKKILNAQKSALQNSIDEATKVLGFEFKKKQEFDQLERDITLAREAALAALLEAQRKQQEAISDVIEKDQQQSNQKPLLEEENTSTTSSSLNLSENFASPPASQSAACEDDFCRLPDSVTDGDLEEKRVFRDALAQGAAVLQYEENHKQT